MSDLPSTDTPPRRRAGDVDGASSKRTLQALSRRIEAFAETLTSSEPITLVGLFQLPEYYEQSRDMYERLAGLADTTVVAGYVGAPIPDSHVDTVSLGPDSELRDFWTVLLLTSRGCAGLRAHDTGQIGSGLSVEAARLFTADVATDPDVVAGWLEELLEHAVVAMDADRRDRLQRAVADAGQHADHGDRAAARALEDAWDAMCARIEDLQHSELLMFTDPLTGARNRRFLERYLDRLGGRAPDVAVAALDFDDFKSINDTYGHAIGDEALRHFARIVDEHVRETDVLVRSGGDEWVLILPGMPLTVARERIRTLIDAAEAQPLSAPGATIRASAGLGVFPAAAVDLEAVDEALYAAKDADGRVIVVGT